MAQPARPFEPGDLVRHWNHDLEDLTVIESNAYYTQVETHDGIDISYPTGNLSLAYSEDAVARLRKLLNGE